MKPGWPFAPAKLDFRDGRIEAFSDWLTAPENPLFARVAVNRLVAMAFRRRLAEDVQRFRRAGRQAVQSRVARLAGVGVCGAQVQHEADAPADGDVRRLQAGVGSRRRSGAGERQGRSGGHLPLAFPPATAGSRADLGFDSRRGRRPGSESGRTVLRHRWRRWPARRRRSRHRCGDGGVESPRRLHDSRLSPPTAMSRRISCRRSTWTTAARRVRCARKRSPLRRRCS